jgi:4-hydroxy-3-methylbut-2-enyl diphosphate reductase
VEAVTGSEAAAARSPGRRGKRVNVRTPDVMARVQAEVEAHYRSELVDRLRRSGGSLTVGNTTVRLALRFGFCYGVERAIDLAYATRRVFPENRVFLIGEIIHNPEVNRQLAEMGIRSLEWRSLTAEYDALGEEDVVIVPAFGAPTHFMDKLKAQGCTVIDTTCGDVVNVWRRVRDYARQGVTSIIHGKAGHEETRATASRALGLSSEGRYLVVLTLGDTDYVCDYIRRGGDREEFLRRFEGAFSEGFDPDLHLKRVGVANQTTMLKSETEELQRRIRQAVIDRDGEEQGDANFQVFDTICGATQERQDALFDLLAQPMDLLLVVGGYNSSNTSHLVEIGSEHLPSFFIRDASCLKSLHEILHFDLVQSREVSGYAEKLIGEGPLVVGITAGASCPSNLIEETIYRVFELRGTPRDLVLAE